MIVAWHMVTSRETDPELPSYNTGRRAYRGILKSGVILPSRLLKRKRKPKSPYKEFRPDYKAMTRFTPWAENPDIKLLDEAAGDNASVFLKLSPYQATSAYLPELIDRHEDLGSLSWGFGFDAEELVLKGCVVRKEDYLRKYEQIAEVLAGDALADVVRKKGYALEDWEYKIAAMHPMTSRISLHFISKHGRMPMLVQALNRYKGLHDLMGEEAMDYLRKVHSDCLNSVLDDPLKPHHKECTFGSPFADLELLWYGPLSLTMARYTIEAGRVKTR